MFRSAFNKRRCLILADGYYEWKKAVKAKQPYFYRLKDDVPFLFAGLWERWKGDDNHEPVETCAVLTTDANELAREVHDRMTGKMRQCRVGHGPAPA
jgi:putative SOS response-associated peptidase YedK